MATSDSTTEPQRIEIRPRVPTRYHGAAEIDVDPRAEPFLSGKATEIAFQGSLGTGKTWAATRTLIEWCRRNPIELYPGERRTPGHFQGCSCSNCDPLVGLGNAALWYDASEAADEIANQWSSQDDNELFDQLRFADCLLLDDLGAESSADAIQAELSQILRYRYNHSRPTIITCQSLDDLEGRVASRFSTLVIGMKGPDRRRG